MSANVLSQLQSTFRPAHSTETAVLQVVFDILQAVDQRDVADLILLDLSSAFDTVDHEVLFQRLWVIYGVSDVIHVFFRSYLSRRTQYVRCGSLICSRCHTWTFNYVNWLTIAVHFHFGHFKNPWLTNCSP